MYNKSSKIIEEPLLRETEIHKLRVEGGGGEGRWWGSDCWIKIP